MDTATVRHKTPETHTWIQLRHITPETHTWIQLDTKYQRHTHGYSLDT